MLKSYRWKWVFLPAVLFIAIPDHSSARENMLTGSLGLRQEYDSNTNLSANEPLSSWSSVLSPGLRLTSRSPTDQLEVYYNLGFKKNHTASENSINHDFLLRGDSKISSRWQAGVLNRFYLSDDSTYAGAPIPDVDKDLSARLDRTRFSLNTFSAHSDYQFAQDSTIIISYENRVLDNKTEGADDFIRHNPGLLVGYKLNQQWRTEVGYNYTRGEFDLADDLETHAGNLRMIYQATPLNQFSVAYIVNQTSFQGPTADYRLHSIIGGWTRNIDHQTTFTATAGQTILDRQHESTLNIFSYSADLRRKLQRGSISISGKGGIDEMHFSGGDQEGLSRYQQLGVSGSYQLAAKILADLALSWRENDFIDNPALGREKIYQASCGLSYGLTSWCQLSTRYQFKELDADNANDGYQDHRFVLELKGTYDMLKW